MAKVYECGFTASGTTQTDTIGGVDITFDTAAVYQTTLTGFVNRPGWYIPRFASTPPALPTSNNNVLYFRDTSRPKKTIILWFRITSGNGDSQLMSSTGSAFTIDGLHGQNGILRFVYNGAVWATLLTLGNYADYNWHMVVVQADFVNSKMIFYVDGVYISTYNSYLGGNNNMVLGEPYCEVGLMQVYDTILNAAEIENLWNTGLIDASTQQPLLTFQGKVYDFNNVVISGADVRVFNHTSKGIDSSVVTTSGGNYTVYFDSVGEYSLSVSKEALTGGRSIPITVTSGGYITYDS